MHRRRTRIASSTTGSSASSADADEARRIDVTRRLRVASSQPDTQPFRRGFDVYLSLRGVSKSFAGVRAVGGVGLHVAKREFICCLGPSGCGKTTLRRTTAGLETPDAADIRLD